MTSRSEHRTRGYANKKERHRAHQGFAILVGAACSVCCLCTIAVAQTPTPSPTPVISGRATIRAVVTSVSDSGSAAPANYDGVFQRVGLQHGQVVSVKLMLPPSTDGLPVTVRAVDGGTLTAEVLNQQGQTQSVSGSAIQIPAVSDENNQVSGTFQYQPTQGSGAYRLYVNAGPDELLLRFWVQDPSHPNAQADIIPAYLPPP